MGEAAMKVQGLSDSALRSRIRFEVFQDYRDEGICEGRRRYNAGTSELIIYNQIAKEIQSNELRGF